MLCVAGVTCLRDSTNTSIEYPVSRIRRVALPRTLLYITLYKMPIAKTESRSSIPFHHDGSNIKTDLTHPAITHSICPGRHNSRSYLGRPRKRLRRQHNQHSFLTTFEHIPPTPVTEPIEVIKPPLPPVSASKEPGTCTTALNPHRTGCIAQDGSSKFQPGDFTPDGKNVIATVTFVGAPAALADPASIYEGVQLILIKADGVNFSNGDPWKCLTCGVPAGNLRGLDVKRDYPHVFRSGDKAIWGHNILDCDGEQLASEACTPDRIHIYPIYWPNTINESGPGGAPRELRMPPDDVDIGWSSFTNGGGQYCYFGGLEFNGQPTTGETRVPRYDMVEVNLLVDPAGRAFITSNGTELQLHPDSITMGELRGFSGSGDEVLYIGAPTELTNIDLYAVHIETGVVRRLTSHPDYADPIAFSANDQWFVTQDTRAAERQIWMSGMRGVLPLIDIVATAVAASTRNNGPRRFFQPILIDRYGDRGSYFGQLVNAGGDGSNGSINDPNWNGRADPAFSLDSTRIVFIGKLSSSRQPVAAVIHCRVLSLLLRVDVSIVPCSLVSPAACLLLLHQCTKYRTRYHGQRHFLMEQRTLRYLS
jgi:hypothetical protein